MARAKKRKLAPRGSYREAVMAALQESPKTIPQLMEDTGYSNSSIRGVVVRGMRDGLIFRNQISPMRIEYGLNNGEASPPVLADSPASAVESLMNATATLVAEHKAYRATLVRIHKMLEDVLYGR